MSHSDFNLDRLSAEERSWIGTDAAGYDAALYGTALVQDIYQHELDLIAPYLKPGLAHIELGSGTGKFCLQLLQRTRLTVGIDVSAQLLAGLTAAAGSAKFVALHGDAALLPELLRAGPLGPDFWESPKLLSCVMNTLGIMPELSRGQVLSAAAKVMTAGDLLYLTVFHREHLPAGVRDYYARSPEYFGELAPGDADYSAGDVRIASSGYFTHWFTVSEVAGLVEAAGLAVREISTHGAGIFALAHTP